jgi:hypothetical protein
MTRIHTWSKRKAEPLARNEHGSHAIRPMRNSFHPLNQNTHYFPLRSVVCIHSSCSYRNKSCFEKGERIIGICSFASSSSSRWRRHPFDLVLLLDSGAVGCLGHWLRLYRSPPQRFRVRQPSLYYCTPYTELPSFWPLTYPVLE